MKLSVSFCVYNKTHKQKSEQIFFFLRVIKIKLGLVHTFVGTSKNYGISK